MKKVLKKLEHRELPVIIEKKLGQKGVYARAKADGFIHVSCPYNYSDVNISAFLDKYYNQLLEYLQNIKIKTNKSLWNIGIFKNNDSIYFFGITYNLKLYKNKNNIIIKDNEIIISHNRGDIIKQWRDFIKKIIKEYSWKFVEKYKDKMQVSVTDIRVRHMKSRWGSCLINSGVITINAELINYPVKCLEMVVLHEMTHLLEKGHNRRFYSIIERYMPNYKEIDRLLKNRE